MEFVEKEINDALEAELNASESDRVKDFEKKAEKTFFATLSGFIDSKFFTNEKGYDKESHQKYNERANRQLLSDLKRLGLNYQKISGVWWGEFEKSYLVWNTAYSWEQFQQIMLKLNEYYKQWGICIGRKVDNEYDIDLWETDNLDNIEYNKTSHFTKLGIIDALKENGTILHRKIYGSNGKISPNKVSKGIVFESLQENFCSAQDKYSTGFYVRRGLLRDLVSNTFNREERNSFEQFRKGLF